MIATMSISSTVCPHCDTAVTAQDLLLFQAKLLTVEAETIAVHLLCQLEAEQCVGYSDVSPPPTNWANVRVVEAAAHDLDARRRRTLASLARRPVSDRQRVMLHRNARPKIDGTSVGSWE